MATTHQPGGMDAEAKLQETKKNHLYVFHTTPQTLPRNTNTTKQVKQKRKQDLRWNQTNKKKTLNQSFARDDDDDDPDELTRRPSNCN